MTISDKAAEKAKALLVQEGKAEWGIRVYLTGESCCGPSYGLNLQEGQMPNDEVIEKNGLRVFVDKHLISSLAGMELDYYSDNEREGFILTGGIPSCGSCNSGCDSCG